MKKDSLRLISEYVAATRYLKEELTEIVYGHDLRKTKGLHTTHLDTFVINSFNEFGGLLH